MSRRNTSIWRDRIATRNRIVFLYHKIEVEAVARAAVWVMIGDLCPRRRERVLPCEGRPSAFGQAAVVNEEGYPGNPAREERPRGRYAACAQSVMPVGLVSVSFKENVPPVVDYHPLWGLSAELHFHDWVEYVFAFLSAGSPYMALIFGAGAIFERSLLR